MNLHCMMQQKGSSEHRTRVQSTYCQKKHIQNQTTSYHLDYHPPSPGHHHLCLNCCVTSSPRLAPIPTPASLPQPQGLWDPLSPTNFWTELLFTQLASLYAFEVCENDSQTGMSGGHLSVSPLFNQLLLKNSVCSFVAYTLRKTASYRVQ